MMVTPLLFSLPNAMPLLLLYVQRSHAYWRFACSISQESRIDPILNPGRLSGHVHKFVGAINVHGNSTWEDLQKGNCSTCQVQSDKSAYWTPILYFEHVDGTFEEVPNSGMTVFYIGRGGNAENTMPFPPGFMMISGQSESRSFDNTTLTYGDVRPVSDRVSFECMNHTDHSIVTYKIGQTDCSSGLKASINFQSCWDGRNLYLDNNAHVDYLSGIEYGTCPPSHPVAIPGLKYEVLYWTNLIDQTGGGRFVLGNGDPTGFSFHGDFVNGWEPNVLRQATQTCLYNDNGGMVEACAPLAASNDLSFATNCPRADPQVHEPIHRHLHALPGCNPVSNGAAPVQQRICPVGGDVSDLIYSDSSSGSTEKQRTHQTKPKFHQHGGTASSLVFRTATSVPPPSKFTSSSLVISTISVSAGRVPANLEVAVSTYNSSSSIVRNKHNTVQSISSSSSSNYRDTKTAEPENFAEDAIILNPSISASRMILQYDASAITVVMTLDGKLMTHVVPINIRKSPAASAATQQAHSHSSTTDDGLSQATKSTVTERTTISRVTKSLPDITASVLHNHEGSRSTAATVRFTKTSTVTLTIDKTTKTLATTHRLNLRLSIGHSTSR